jgi:DNA mismatch repair protein MutH
MDRAASIAGGSLGEVAERLDVPVPDDLRRAKGWVGELIERALGATAGSRAGPDFPELGVELKTLPIDHRGRPLESTFVCTISLGQVAEVEFEKSPLWCKLRSVLWVPVRAERSIPVGKRQIGTPVLWEPTEQQRQQLKSDWESAATMIAEGRTYEITGHLGLALQVRPKAAKGSSRRLAFDEEGALYEEQPKGFYLRPSFTHQILIERFGL